MKGLKHLLGGLLFGGLALVAALAATGDATMAVAAGAVGFLGFLLIVGSRIAWISTFVALAGLGFRYIEHEPDRFAFGLKTDSGHIDARAPVWYHRTLDACVNEHRAAIEAHRDQYACRPICNPNSKPDCFIEELQRDFLSLNERYFANF